jgi:hypothetical protein
MSERHPGGFLQHPRIPIAYRDPHARTRDFEEIYSASWREQDLRAQGARCMDCGVPTCTAGCPIGNLIPDCVISPMSTLGLRDTIYASVTTTGAASNASLGARWTFGADQLVDSTTVTIAPTGPAVTEFHIMRGSAWPKGSYAVTIFLNGQQAAQRQFEVK